MATKVIKPPKKKKSVDPDEKGTVLKLYADQEARNAKRFQSDLKKAMDQKESIVKSEWGGKMKNNKSVLRKAWMAAGKGAADKEIESVKKQKEGGAYSSSPAIVGGSKKMIKRSKKNVRKNSASKAAKKSAKSLY